MAPGILVPSAEQKQSGRIHWFVSQSGALLGSVSTAVGGKAGIKKFVSRGISAISESALRLHIVFTGSACFPE